MAKSKREKTSQKESREFKGLILAGLIEEAWTLAYKLGYTLQKDGTIWTVSGKRKLYEIDTETGQCLIWW